MSPRLVSNGWRWLLAATLVVGLALALRPLAAGEGPENWFPVADKLHHLGFFALLWWLALRAGAQRGWRLGLALMLYGVGMELAQALLTATRGASFFDLLADSAGLLTGDMLTRWWARRSSSGGQPQEHGR